ERAGQRLGQHLGRRAGRWRKRAATGAERRQRGQLVVLTPTGDARPRYGNILALGDGERRPALLGGGRRRRRQRQRREPGRGPQARGGALTPRFPSAPASSSDRARRYPGRMSRYR